MSDFGLIGRHLGHSHSPALHKMLGGYNYDLIELEPQELGSYFKSRSFKGINVTVPYKKAVIPFCDKLSNEAKRIGSVNTVVSDGGILTGYNTDYFGFRKALSYAGIDVGGKKCLILGNGGVSPTVKAALEDLEASEIITVSRSGEVNYVNLCNHYDAEVIVNATPVGMYPDNGRSLVDLECFPKCKAVFDLVYNPLRTELVCQAERLGIFAVGGLYMLAAQAAAAVSVFTGAEISDENLEAAYKRLLKDVGNIVLIGMPGCGKSTTATELCKLTGRKTFDVDAEIEKRCGFSIPDYFLHYGEAAFRRFETEVLVDITMNVGCVIATGGGVVTRGENYSLLHQNGSIVFLERDINSLPKSGRPISLSTPIEDIAQARLPIYRRWADLTVSAKSEYDAASIIAKELL